MAISKTHNRSPRHLSDYIPEQSAKVVNSARPRLMAMGSAHSQLWKLWRCAAWPRCPDGPFLGDLERLREFCSGGRCPLGCRHRPARPHRANLEQCKSSAADPLSRRTVSWRTARLTLRKRNGIWALAKDWRFLTGVTSRQPSKPLLKRDPLPILQVSGNAANRRVQAGGRPEGASSRQLRYCFRGAFECPQDLIAELDAITMTNWQDFPDPMQGRDTIKPHKQGCLGF